MNTNEPNPNPSKNDSDYLLPNILCLGLSSLSEDSASRYQKSQYIPDERRNCQIG
jgi:hypothetical protein